MSVAKIRTGELSVPSNNFAAFLYYILERERIRIKKEAGEPWPWTGDKILQTYKFTNVKRINDRTTQTFLRHYFRHYYFRHYEEANNVELLYNCGVGRYFGTEEFQRNVGWLHKHDRRKLITTAQAMFKRGEKVFTGAYMITNAQIAGPKECVVADFLHGLWRKAPAIVDAMIEQRTWEAGYNAMQTLPGFKGTGFMAKEVLQDFLLVTSIPIDDAATWTPMGPGARRGINRLLNRPYWFQQRPKVFIWEVQQLHKQLKNWWSDKFPETGELTAHDVQFCLCEFDKYERVRKGQGKPRSLYRRSA